MKTKTHPNYQTSTITCACGAVLSTGSTEQDMHTEICSQCHPFYTGKKKVMDTTGRVDRFKKLSEKTAKKKMEMKELNTKKAKRTAKKDQTEKTPKKAERSEKKGDE